MPNEIILAQAETTTGGGFTSIAFLVVMVAVFWLLFIRPQRRRMKQQQSLQASIETGDVVQTIGGIHGRVVAVLDDGVVLEIESGRMKVAKRAIASKVNPQDG